MLINGKLFELRSGNLEIELVIIIAIFVFIAILLLLLPSFVFFYKWSKSFSAPTEVYLISQNGISVISKKSLTSFSWSEINLNKVNFYWSGKNYKSANVIFHIDELTMKMENIDSYSEIFQFIDRQVSKNVNLSLFNDFIKKNRRQEDKNLINHKNHGKRSFSLLNAINNKFYFFLIKAREFLLFLVFSSIIIMLSSAISTIEIQDDEWFFIFGDGMINLISIVFIYALIKHSMDILNKKSKDDSVKDLLSLPSFRTNLYMLSAVIIGYSYYFLVRVLGFDLLISEIVYKIILGMIPIGFIIHAILVFSMKKTKDRIKPILFLREFGVNSLAMKFSNSLSKEITTEDSIISDPMLYFLRKSSYKKPIFAYFDRKLDPNGFKENVFNYLEESEDWLNNVEKCALLSSNILVLPSASKSLIEEMQMIRKNDFSNRTFIIMPYEAIGETSIKKDWNKIRKKLKKYDFQLPKYNRKGMIYQPGNKFEIKKKWNFYNGFADIKNIPKFYRLSFENKSIYKIIHEKLPFD